LRKNETLHFNIVKSEYDDIGLDFETPLMDKKHSCENKCIFCFIDQLPKGLRKTLYFKDDDSRLSFLHGNYITLTNLDDKDIDRIIEMHISPVNVSVHTTNPELRVKMMKNKRSGEVLSYLKRFADAGIHICAQIVLCKNINDGAELMRSMKDLTEYFPALQSVSIVPAGKTKFRDNLHHLESFTKEDCQQVIKQVEEFANECLEKYGSRLFFCADEFYIKAEIALHDDEYYEGYAQIENGVGMLTSLLTEFGIETKYIEEYLEKYRSPRRVSVVTGMAAKDQIIDMCNKLCEIIEGLEITVYPIVNDFFGHEITVSGLLTGKDIFEQFKDKELWDELILPPNVLRSEGDLFLCGMSIEELSDKLNVKIRLSSNDGAGFISAMLGID
jgi:putative radical SAM enzyme (TIGR03279 family)